MEFLTTDTEIYYKYTKGKCRSFSSRY